MACKALIPSSNLGAAFRYFSAPEQLTAINLVMTTWLLEHELIS